MLQACVAYSLPALNDEAPMLEFWKNLHFNSRDLAAHAAEAITLLEKTKTELTMA